MMPNGFCMTDDDAERCEMVDADAQEPFHRYTKVNDNTLCEMLSPPNMHMTRTGSRRNPADGKPLIILTTVAIGFIQQRLYFRNQCLNMLELR